MANYTAKFVKKFNYKFVFAILKRYKYSKKYPTDLFKKEMNFFKKFMEKENFEYLLEHAISKENLFSSYLAMFQSKVTVALINSFEG